MTIILADIDHFKQINDSLGHAAGDEALKEIARRLRSDLRPYDLAGRYGGEEFLVVLPTCQWEHAVPRAEQLRLMASKDPVSTQFGNIAITLSMGVTVSNCCSDLTAEQLLQLADKALYSAKELGRNCVQALKASIQMHVRKAHAARK